MNQHTPCGAILAGHGGLQFGRSCAVAMRKRHFVEPCANNTIPVILVGIGLAVPAFEIGNIVERVAEEVLELAIDVLDPAIGVGPADGDG